MTNQIDIQNLLSSLIFFKMLLCARIYYNGFQRFSNVEIFKKSINNVCLISSLKIGLGQSCICHDKLVGCAKLFVISNFHIVPVARLEYFRALKFSRLESFRALKPYGQIGGFQGPKTLGIGEFQGPKFSRLDNFMNLMYFGQIGVFSDTNILRIGEFQGPKTLHSG